MDELSAWEVGNRETRVLTGCLPSGALLSQNCFLDCMTLNVIMEANYLDGTGLFALSETLDSSKSIQLPWSSPLALASGCPSLDISTGLLLTRGLASPPLPIPLTFISRLFVSLPEE